MITHRPKLERKICLHIEQRSLHNSHHSILEDYTAKQELFFDTCDEIYVVKIIKLSKENKYLLFIE